jgi:hypothetical protein
VTRSSRNDQPPPAGGTSRVAGIFLPRVKGAIRIKSPNQRIAVARRSLARAIEPRRFAS